MSRTAVVTEEAKKAKAAQAKTALTKTVLVKTALAKAAPTKKGGLVKKAGDANKRIIEKIVVRDFNGLRRHLRTAPQQFRFEIESDGVGYQIVRTLPDALDIQQNVLLEVLGVPKATYTKKVRERTNFTGAPGYSVVGLADLVNFAEDMLVGSDVPKDFNVEAWVGDWLQVQQPALGGKAPAELMATPSGRDTVRRLLGAIQSGAYQ